MAGEPGFGEQGREVFFGWLVDELFKEPSEVGGGVFALAADLLDQGVDDGGLPAGFGSPDEEPVFHAELCGADVVLDPVVVPGDLFFFEAGEKFGPLVTSVFERLSQCAFWQDCSSVFLEMGKEIFEVVVGAGEEEFSRSFSQFGTGPPPGKAAFEVVDFTDLIQDPGGDFRVVAEGTEEFSSNVGEAADGDDFELFVFVAFEEGLVACEAVALEEAFKRGFSFGVDEDVVEAGV